MTRSDTGRELVDGWVLNSRVQAFVPELELGAGVRLDGNVALNQAAGKIRAFRAGLMDAVDSAIPQGASLAHLAFEPSLAMTALASHF
jgi:hypothetical protein